MTEQLKDLQIKFRASHQDKDVYQQAADAAGLTLSDWMRSQLDAAAIVPVVDIDIKRGEENDAVVDDAPESPGAVADDGDVADASLGSTSPATSAHILIFGGIAENGAFASALFEISTDAAFTLMQRLGVVAAIADARQEEMNALRAENVSLAQRLQGVMLALGGEANGQMVPYFDRVGDGSRRRRRHVDRTQPGERQAPEADGGNLGDDDQGSLEPQAFDVGGMMNELAALSEPEPALDPDEIPPERTWAPRMTLFVTQRMWLPEWGPLPGRPGCEVPDDILERHGYPPI